MNSLHYLHQYQYHPHSRYPSHSRNIFLPTSCVFLVIGWTGETVKSFQDKSGAEIYVIPDQQAQPNQVNRSILITGSDDAISTAIWLVSDIFLEARSGRKDYYHVTCRRWK